MSHGTETHHAYLTTDKRGEADGQAHPDRHHQAVLPVVRVGVHRGAKLFGGPQGQVDSLQGIDKLLPVDVYISGCPPRPEALLEGFMKLQRIIEGEKPIEEQIAGIREAQG